MGTVGLTGTAPGQFREIRQVTNKCYNIHDMNYDGSSAGHGGGDMNDNVAQVDVKARPGHSMTCKFWSAADCSGDHIEFTGSHYGNTHDIPAEWQNQISSFSC
eukprot:TRINITY_DN96542_c0_g1_i1.p1 TRINITY_DN96542_c0_g1~~TRINITY_DN96542_c0_g1_i1.p1  ORF type:complete len:103 (+),score=9.55 TRINITY_DN96542_c0_g1_i1:121-429(+)